ncbi:MAG: PIG-L family deacetylase [Lachnospiraceae bacterium]|nr:PIG-L family deacetylase [Lachnospiraceae bacterium]
MNVRKEIEFNEEDKIAVIAPHPDDECLGASAALILAPQKTDIYVLTDGSRGAVERTPEEEVLVRRAQFEAEMEYVKPHSYTWLGGVDTKMSRHRDLVIKIDFRPYTIIFLPWLKSFHPDHRYASAFCLDEIRSQKAEAACYFYEIKAPFYDPTHYVDITGICEEKKKTYTLSRRSGSAGRTCAFIKRFQSGSDDEQTGNEVCGNLSEGGSGHGILGGSERHCYFHNKDVFVRVRLDEG